MNSSFKLFFLSVLMTCSLSLSAQNFDEEHPHPLIDTLDIHHDVFDLDDPARISLTLDIRKFAKKKYEDEYQEAVLAYELGTGDVVEKTVRIKARGNNRRKRCFFPPIKLNIKKAHLEDEFGDDTKTIKLVTHCKNSVVYEKYILKEYLIYKLFNVISPNSFRVRLLEVDYIDTGKKGKDVHTWAFLIEPEGLLAERLAMTKVKNDNLSQKYMEPSDMIRVTLFNYMIGNTDYSVTGRHNVKVLMPEDVTKTLGVPIPYDFDYAGMVNATYAVPYEGLNIKSVKERYYLGSCANIDNVGPVLEEFKAKKAELLKVIEDFEHLPEQEKKYAIDYIEEFFNAADHSNFIVNNLKSTCL